LAFDSSTTSPVVLAVDGGEGFRQYMLRVPVDSEYLEGHFPGFPVVPAVVQLQWVMRCAHELLGREPSLHTIEALKFKRLLRPAQTFYLRVDVTSGGDAMTFRLWSDEWVFSSGRCLLNDSNP
jgi:3-hydroxymyristoyl/3-hydroxydecanoyl-(acyl carrier protein) dehydratase